ncbi:hypothetical protein [Flavilitoribacter nigricans]|uniref:Uncharacterized protein n=1 Tax=Flavilitoribacter nigricans (strain ATCC 23147 / DSM 23189 / NBRC 102662 / NCIMB 1420 / SS-2) TaxID=1122177 RepID=A0A2D0NB57_FLAN2|nr:hypothetical protein [Flavilitoribacter nigricans]PHN05409.1 hypothetical protein CRP01_15540 [Flavilitoribacter nigricans DSM 23189 = NBRC 102662]
MVQKISKGFSKSKELRKKTNPFIISIIFLFGVAIYFGLPPFLEKGQDGGYILSRQRQEDFDKKPLKSENVEVYRLIAGLRGNYPCINCNKGIQQILLFPGEVWKYGISRNGRKRYNENFYSSSNLVYQTITITDILSAEKLELELIIGYPLLPECQKRMKLQQIFLKRPPGNAIDK